MVLVSQFLVWTRMSNLSDSEAIDNLLDDIDSISELTRFNNFNHLNAKHRTKIVNNHALPGVMFHPPQPANVVTVFRHVLTDVNSDVSCTIQLYRAVW
jgi:hypothetical protein